MAVGVVDGFEVIDIDQSHHPGLSAHTRQGGGGRFHITAAEGPPLPGPPV